MGHTTDGEFSGATLRELLQRLALEHGEFELSAGGTTSVYVDARQVSLTGQGACLIGQAFWERVREIEPDARAIGGMTLGADPLVTATSLAAHHDGRDLEGILVRKASKDYGTGERVEAPSILEPGDHVVALDDTVTTGGSTIDAVEQMREAGFTIRHALCVVDREAGARENLAEAGVELHSLFALSDLVDDGADS